LISPELLTLVQKQDQRACKKVFELFSARFLATAKRYLGDTPEAEDAASMAFVKIFQNVTKAEFVNAGAFVGWMKRILVNECLMILRKRSSFTIVPDDELRHTSIEPDTINKMTVEEIMKIVKELPVGYRTVFNLFVVEGYSHKEIAEKLGVSEGTSKSQLNHAKKMLQIKMLKAYGKEAKY
jgi:RNA polymerase sigma-70 factor (ECF subfamily)